MSQRRRSSGINSSGMYSQPPNSVQTVVTTSGGEATPVAGGRSYAFWLLVGVVLLVAVFNLLITLTLLSVLRVSVGMESLQVTERAMILSGAVDLDSVFKPDGAFLGFHEESMSVTGDGGTVDLLVSSGGGSAKDDDQRVSLTHSGVSVQGVKGAGVRAAAAGSFFSTAFPDFGLPSGVRSLRVRDVRSRRVVSPVDRALQLRSATQTHLRGAEGTHLDGKSVVFSADQELYLKSVNGSVSLRGAAGVRLDVGGVPWAAGRRAGRSAPAQYRLCACVPGGRLFRMPVPVDNEDRPPGRRVTCGHAALYGDSSPCA